MLEMMLVVVIMGILASVAIYNMAGASNSARISATRAQLRTIMAAIQTYQGQYASPPPDLVVLTDPSRGLLQKSALKDGWKEFYVYSPVGSSNDPNHGFDLYSKGPDKLPMTTDDIDGWLVIEE